MEKIHQEFSKMFDSERNKQHQRVICNEIRRLPSKTYKQLAIRIETLVQKAYSLNTHDYKNTKMTEILIMTLTTQLRKTAIKERASHPSSILEPDLDFRKLVDKLEQAEITMKLEETESLKLQYVNRIETNITHINNIQDSDVDLSEKLTEVLNIYERNPNFKGKPYFKKWCNYCRRYGHSFAECRQKQQENQNKPQKYKKPKKSFYQYMEKDQNLPNNSIHSNNSCEKPLPGNSNYSRNQSPYKSSFSEITIHDRIQTEQNLLLHPVPIQTPGIYTIPTIGHETHHTIEREIIPTIGIEVIQIIEIKNIKQHIKNDFIQSIKLSKI